MALTDVTIPNARCHCPEIRSREGNYFVVARNTSNATLLRCMMSTDPGTEDYTAVDDSNAPAAAWAIQAISYDVRDNMICVAFQRIRNGADTDDLYFAAFDMSSDSWVDFSGNTEVLVDNADCLSQVSCQMVVLYDRLEIVAAGPFESVSGPRPRVSVYRSTDLGATWDAGQYVSGGGTTENEYCGRALPQDQGWVSYAWAAFDGSAVNIMTRAANTSGTLQTKRDTSFNANSAYPLGWPTYIDRNVHLCCFPFNNASAQLRVLRFTGNGSDVSSFLSDQISSDSAYNPAGAFDCAAVSLRLDGTHFLRALWVSTADRDIDYAIDIDNSWGLATGTLTAGTFDSVALSINDHAGPKLSSITGASLVPAQVKSDISDSINQLSLCYIGWNVVRHGPHYASGAFYTPMWSVTFGRIFMLKAANLNPADGDWSDVGDQLLMPRNDRIRQDYVPDAAIPNNRNGLRSMVAQLIGTDIHVCAVQEPGTMTHSIFDTTTDEWTQRLRHIGSGWDTDHGAVSLGVIDFDVDIGNGNILVASNKHETAGYAFGRFGTSLYFEEDDGGFNWLAEGDDDNGNNSWVNGVVRDNNNDFTYFFWDQDAAELRAIFVGEDGTVNSSFLIDDAADTSVLKCAKPILIGSVIYIAYVDADDNIVVRSFTPGSSPTVSGPTIFSGSAVHRNSATGNPMPGNFMALLDVKGAPVVAYVRASDQAICLGYEGLEIVAIPGVTVTQMMSASYDSRGAFLFLFDNSGVPTFSSGRWELLGQVTANESAQGVGAIKALAVGQVTENDSTSSMTIAKDVALAQVSEDDSVEAFAISKDLSIGQVTEDDSAQSFSITLELEIAQVSESASSLALTVERSVDLDEASEDAEALAMTISIGVSLGQVTEDSTAQALTAEKSQPIGQVSEDGSAGAFGIAKDKAIGLVNSEETAQPLTSGSDIPILQVAADESARSFGVLKELSIAQVSTDDSAQSFGASKDKTIGMVTSDESAMSFSTSFSIQIGQVISDESVSAFSVSKDLAIGRVIEDNFALSFSVDAPGLIRYLSSSGVEIALSLESGGVSFVPLS